MIIFILAVEYRIHQSNVLRPQSLPQSLSSVVQREPLRELSAQVQTLERRQVDLRPAAAALRVQTVLRYFVHVFWGALQGGHRLQALPCLIQFLNLVFEVIT